MHADRTKGPAARREPWQGVPEARRSVMRANRRRDTGPERQLRSALHAAGLRFRVDMPIRPGGGRPVRPDIVFTRQRVAVFIDGCFWHGCPIHWSRSKTNTPYWDEKVLANRERDARTTAALKADGWTVVRVWEHEEIEAVTHRVAGVVRGDNTPWAARAMEPRRDRSFGE
jgi:DNA mismatch endonuclease, patch repair protein